MIIEVYARRRFSPEATAFVAQLRAEGRQARQQDPRHFEERQIDPQTVFVYHDGTDPLVPWAYGKRGIPCELIPAIAGETTHAASDDHHLVKVEGGFALIDPAGSQVGDTASTEADAWWARFPTGDMGVAVRDGQTGEDLAQAPTEETTGDDVGVRLPELESVQELAAPLSEEDEELAQLQRELDALDAPPPPDEQAQE